MITRHRRFLPACAAICAAALALAGCGAGDSGSDSAEENIVSVYGTEPAHGLTGGAVTEAGGGKVVDQLYAGLTSFGKGGKIENEVADTITPNDDATEYTITLKKGWKFSDGTPVTSHSFVDAWNYTANPKNAQGSATFFNTIQGYDELQKTQDPKATLSGLSTPDDDTIVIKLSQPDSALPAKLGSHGYTPLPESAFKDMKAFGEKPVTNGPYTFVSWDHNKSIVLKKNPDYKGNRMAKNDGLEFRIYTSPVSAYADVQGGHLDFTHIIPPNSAKSFQNDTTLKAYNQSGANAQAFVIPESLEHFQQGSEEGNLRRQAISMSIDRKTVTKKIFNGIKTPAKDFLAPTLSAYSEDLKGNDVLEYNPTKAKELWAKANEISPWSGTFKIAYASDGGGKDWVNAVCNYISNTLGIDAKGDPSATSTEFYGLVDSGKINAAFTSLWGPDYPSADNYLVTLYASSAADGKGSNNGNYKNPAFDELMDKALASPTAEQADDYYRQGEEILLQDLPAIPLWNENAVAVSTKNITNVGFDYSGGPLFTNLTKN